MHHDDHTDNARCPVHCVDIDCLSGAFNDASGNKPDCPDRKRVGFLFGLLPLFLCALFFPSCLLILSFPGLSLFMSMDSRSWLGWWSAWSIIVLIVTGVHIVIRAIWILVLLCAPHGHHAQPVVVWPLLLLFG